MFTPLASVPTAAITALQVKVNYQGPSYDRQTWTWQIFDWTANAYVTIGTNSAITPALD